MVDYLNEAWNSQSPKRAKVMSLEVEKLLAELNREYGVTCSHFDDSLVYLTFDFLKCAKM